MAKWCVYPPQQDVYFPVDVLEQVNNWLEGVVGSWFGVGQLVQKKFKADLVLFVKEKVFSEGV